MLGTLGNLGTFGSLGSLCTSQDAEAEGQDAEEAKIAVSIPCSCRRAGALLSLLRCGDYHACGRSRASAWCRRQNQQTHTKALDHEFSNK